MQVTRELVWRVVGYLAAVMIMLYCGQIYAFNAYSEALKVRMGYSQIDVNLIAAVLNVGACVAPPAGIVMDRFGQYPTLVVGGLLLSGGYLLAWAAASFRIASTSSLMCFIFAVVGQGANWLYFASLMLSIRNFPPYRRGLVVGILEAAYGASAAIFAAIYGEAYGLPADDPARQDVVGFLLLLALTAAGVTAVSLATMRSVPPTAAPLPAEHVFSDADESSKLLVVAVAGERSPEGAAPAGTGGSGAATPLTKGYRSINDDDNDSSDGKDSSSSTVVGAWVARCLPSRAQLLAAVQVFTHLNFWCVFIVFLTASSVALAYVDNVNFMLIALGMNTQVGLHTTLMPVASTVGRISMGILSDVCLHRWRVSRAKFMLVPVLLLTVTHLLLVFLMADVMLPATLAVGFSAGAIWVMGAPLVSEEFGLAQAGANWGYVILSSAAGLFLYQYVYGAVYAAHLLPGQTQCLGADCYRLSFIVALATLVPALVCVVVLIRRVKIPAWAGKTDDAATAVALAAEGEAAAALTSAGTTEEATRLRVRPPRPDSFEA